MLIAVLGDMDGQLPALEAVLTALEDDGIQTITAVGNLLGPTPYVSDLVALIRDAKIPALMGEWDRMVGLFQRKQSMLAKKLSPDEYAAVETTYNALDAHALEFLRLLPAKRLLRLDGMDYFFSHKIVGIDENHLERHSFERTREALNQPLILFGSPGRQPITQRVHDTLFVNPGPLVVQEPGGWKACYTLVNTEEEPWTATHHRITLAACSTSRMA